MLILMGCPSDEDFNPDIEELLINISQERLIFHVRFPKGEKKDTTLFEDFPWHEYYFEEYIIEPFDTLSEKSYSNGIRNALEEGWIIYYIFNYDSVIAIPWERIRDEYIVAKRVDFESWEELEECNFTITYP